MKRNGTTQAQPITLTLRDFADRVHQTPSYLSNGHWAIRTGLVANAALFTSEQAVTAQRASASYHVQTSDETLRVPADLGAWTATPFEQSREPGRDGKPRRVRLYYCATLDAFAGYDTRSLELLAPLGTAELYAEDATRPAFVWRHQDERAAGAPADAVLMPVRLDAAPGGFAITRVAAAPAEVAA